MGKKFSKIKDPIDDNCPICLISNKKLVSLECGHKYHPLCLQEYITEILFEKESFPCPICRKEYSWDQINKIYNKYNNITKIDPKFITRDDYIDLLCYDQPLLFLKGPIFGMCNKQLVKTYFPFKKYKSIGIPTYFISPVLSQIRHYHILNKNLFNKHIKLVNNNIHGPYDSHHIGYFDTVNANWFKKKNQILNKINKKIRLKKTPNYMIFSIENKNKIIIYNSNNGEYYTDWSKLNLNINNEDFDIKYRIIYSPIIFDINKQLFWINRVIGIIVGESSVQIQFK